jgi:histidyl-tRNA synthetase
VEQAALLKPEPVEAYIAWMSHEALPAARRLARDLRGANLRVEMPFELLKLKRSLGIAGRLQARFAIIIGENETASGRYQVKDLGTGQQEEVETAQIASYLEGRLELLK